MARSIAAPGRGPHGLPRPLGWRTHVGEREEGEGAARSHA